MSSKHRLATLALTLAGAFALGALGALGCGNPPCIRHSDCNIGLICGEAGVCILPPDAAPDDTDGGDGVDATPRPDATPEPDAGPPPDADTTIEGPDAS